MSDRKQSAAHPRTGHATGVMKDVAEGSQSRASKRPSRMEAQEAAAPLQPGSVVAGRYRIERLLGVGGMGAVYEATQVAISRRVALKVVRADYAGDKAMAARFQREARAASAVQHPSIVMVHDFGQAEDGTLFMVMELLSGESLLQRMRRESRLDPREAVRIAVEVASALEAAHDAGVVHRDLKPDNVLLLDALSGTPGKVKVLDFGIARIVDRTGAHPALSEGASLDAAGLTEVGQVLGTPRYMSPEAVARMPVGPAADLYALGAIVFEMITGHPVFTEKEPVILMGQHLRTPPPRLADSLPEGCWAPAGLDALIAELLAKMPTERPATAAIVRQRLLALDWTEPALPALDPDPEPEPERPPAPRVTEPATTSSVFTPPPEDEVAPAQFVRGKSPFRRAMRFSPIVLLAGGIAGLLYLHRVRLEERREQQQSVTAEVAAPPVPVVEPRVETVRMTVAGAPTGARYLWDSQVMEGRSFEVPFDSSRPHLLEVSARGYVTRQIEVIPDGPHELSVTLERARRRAPTKSGASSGAPPGP